MNINYIELIDLAEEIKAEFPQLRVSVPSFDFIGVLGEITTKSGIRVHIFHSIHNRGDWEQAREDLIRCFERAAVEEAKPNRSENTENEVLTEVEHSDII
jgi:hypothetical protein